MTAHVVYSAGTWGATGMDNQVCDRHSSARAKAKVILPSLGTLYFCMHCSDTLDFGTDYHVIYEPVSV